MSKLGVFFARPIRPVADFFTAFVLGGITFGFIVCLIALVSLLFTGKPGLISKPDVALPQVAIHMGVQQ